MTVRDMQHHLARTVGTELSHDTISKITDGVAPAAASRPAAGTSSVVGIHVSFSLAARTGRARESAPGPGRRC